MNQDIKNNYFRVESLDIESQTATPSEGSFFFGSNSGFISSQQNERTGGTTISHEYGHSLGFGHHPAYDRKNKRIMNTEKQLGKDAKYRKVTQQDIDGLGIPSLKFNNGKANIGEKTNTYYEKDLRTGYQPYNK